MINRENGLFRDDYFVCDKCGRGYSFSNSFLTVRKGDEYRPLINGILGDLTVAECDLCRDCAGQSEKTSGIAAHLETEIAAIDEAANQIAKREGLI